MFDGFLRVYREGRDEDRADDEHERPLPAMKGGERAFVTEVRPERRFTRPPPRFTEAGLVRRLEELGIGRPSTYASILGVLKERNYVVLHNRRFVPMERGRVVTAFLEEYFGRWVAYGFTDELEKDLDRVARGDAAWEGSAARLLGRLRGCARQGRRGGTRRGPGEGQSGCRAEQARLRTAERLVRLLAVFCILSWRVFWLTMLNRIKSDLEASLVLTELETSILDRLIPDPTAHSFPPAPSRDTSSRSPGLAAISTVPRIRRRETSSCGAASLD